MKSHLPLTLLLLGACSRAPANSDVDLFVDSDGDGILDVHEGDADPDGDGVPALRDLDSDGDGIHDEDEAGDDALRTLPFDRDGDQMPDFLDLDSDGNGIPDSREGTDGIDLFDADGDGILDSSDLDDDDDGLSDLLEMTEGRDVDSDRDGRVDRVDEDSDRDGLRDLDEGACSGARPCDSDGDGVPDRLDDDSDGDGLSDRGESGVSSGLADPPLDTDGDGLYDARDPDSDGDGLSDIDEVAGPTDHLLWDTDGDGLSDQVELQLGLDPVDPESRWEGPMVSVRARHEAELAIRATVGLEKLDVVLVMGSLKEAHHGLPYLLDGWAELDPPARSVAFSVAHTSTFGRRPWGCSEDPAACGYEELLPQRAAYVPVPMTTDTRRMGFWATNVLDVMTAAQSLSAQLNYAESLVQIAAGTGYDVDCDGRFDELIDQPAWPPRDDDPFGGEATPAWDPGLFTPLGERGAVGFREGSARLIFPMGAAVPRRCMAYHLPAEEPPADLPSVQRFYFEGPEICRPYSDWDDAAAALVDAHAWVAYRTRSSEPATVKACGVTPAELTGYEPLPALGWATGSVGDLDGDGTVEPYHVEEVPFRDDLFWEDNMRRRYREEARPLLEDIRRRLDPDRVVPVVRSDPRGFVTHITPSEVIDPDYDDVVELSLTFRGTVAPEEGDQAFLVDLALVGDGHWDMYTETVLVVVPGWTRM